MKTQTLLHTPNDSLCSLTACKRCFLPSHNSLHCWYCVGGRHWFAAAGIILSLWDQKAKRVTGRDEGPEARRATKSKTRLIMEQIHQSLTLHLCRSLVIHPQALLSFRWKSFQKAWREKWLWKKNAKWSTSSYTLAIMPCNLDEGGRWMGGWMEAEKEGKKRREHKADI